LPPAMSRSTNTMKPITGPSRTKITKRFMSPPCRSAVP
jgi:hypothetical protein